MPRRWQSVLLCAVVLLPVACGRSADPALPDATTSTTSTSTTSSPAEPETAASNPPATTDAVATDDDPPKPELALGDLPGWIVLRTDGTLGEVVGDEIVVLGAGEHIDLSADRLDVVGDLATLSSSRECDAAVVRVSLDHQVPDVEVGRGVVATMLAHGGTALILSEDCRDSRSRVGLVSPPGDSGQLPAIDLSASSDGLPFRILDLASGNDGSLAVLARQFDGEAGGPSWILRYELGSEQATFAGQALSPAGTEWKTLNTSANGYIALEADSEGHRVVEFDASLARISAFEVAVDGDATAIVATPRGVLLRVLDPDGNATWMLDGVRVAALADVLAIHAAS